MAWDTLPNNLKFKFYGTLSVWLPLPDPRLAWFGCRENLCWMYMALGLSRCCPSASGWLCCVFCVEVTLLPISDSGTLQILWMLQYLWGSSVHGGKGRCLPRFPSRTAWGALQPDKGASMIRAGPLGPLCLGEHNIKEQIKNIVMDQERPRMKGKDTIF